MFDFISKLISSGMNSLLLKLKENLIVHFLKLNQAKYKPK